MPMPYSGTDRERSNRCSEVFKTAWSDVTQSPHWVTRILLLVLLSFIPVFGWIVIAGYLWGWARDMAWGVHAPLPERIFENADGTLYSRGFFAAVIAVVCAVVMSVLQSAGGLISTRSFAGSAFVWGDVHSIYQTVAPLGLVSGLLSLFSFAVLCAVSFIVTLFKWVGTMRMSIYGRLSAGFQVSRIWAMIRHDFKGILRILGMWLIVSFVVGIAIALAISVVIFAGILCVSFSRTWGFCERRLVLAHRGGSDDFDTGRFGDRSARSVSRRVGLRPRHTCSGALDLPVRCCELARAGRPDAV